MIGGTALAAIGLVAPFLSFSIFVSSIINSGTIRNYSYYVGCFDKRRALEFFSQGVYMAVLSGVIYAAVLFAAREFIIDWLTIPGKMQEYTRDYFSIILLLYLFNPLSYLLDNMTVADGGEKLSVGANVVFIVSNVVLSYILGRAYGIKGVAFASVASKILFILIISLHFISKTNTLHLLRGWRNKDCVIIVRSGIVKASTYAMEAIAVFLVNLFAMDFFDPNTIIVLIMVEKFLGLLTLFIGLSMAAQPLIGTLAGEKNNKALRYLMRTVCFDMVRAGILLTVLTYIFTPFLVRAFGIVNSAMLIDGVIALRIVSATLVLHALLVLFFIYYYLIDKQRLAFEICLTKDVISPLVLAVLLSMLMGTHIGMWLGLASAPVISTIICSQLALRKYARSRRKEFPFLLPEDMDENIYIYDFDISPESAVEISRTADALLSSRSVSAETRMQAGLFLEEMLLLIMEKNAGSKASKVSAECTIIFEPSGTRLILRDSGILFDITDEDSPVSSFRQYLVSRLMVTHDQKAYMTTTGYNRNELFFEKAANAAGAANAANV